MEKLKKLISNCKCEVGLTVNEHLCDYETVEQFFSSYRKDDLEDIDKEVYSKMIETNMIINLHFYPDTPVGFYSIYHYDLELALDKALEILKLN